MHTEILKHIAVWLVYSLHKETRGQELCSFSGCGIGVSWDWEHLSWEVSKPVFTQVLLVRRAAFVVVNLSDGLQ